MRVDRCADTGTIKISQAEYTKAVLQKFKCWTAGRVPLHRSRMAKMTAAQETTSAHHGVKFLYREAVPALLYLSNCTRPDISVAVNQAARYCNNPYETNVIAVKRVMRYLAGTINNDIAFVRSKLYPELKAYVDADWAGDKSDRKSISGLVYCSMVQLSGAPSSNPVWPYRQQKPIRGSVKGDPRSTLVAPDAGRYRVPAAITYNRRRRQWGCSHNGQYTCDYCTIQAHQHPPPFFALMRD